MARKVVVDAISAHLAANWARCPVIPANAQGETPADGSPFVVLQFPVANTDRMTVNQRFYREDGAFRLVLATETGSGTDTALQWGDELADLFRDTRIGGVECLVPTSPLIHDDNEDGQYFKTSVVVPFRFDFQD